MTRKVLSVVCTFAVQHSCGKEKDVAKVESTTWRVGTFKFLEWVDQIFFLDEGRSTMVHRDA